MTDLVRGKRERLIDGALQTLHAQGVESTTLADIAKAAEVPVGNVYYYFKTKDDLVEAAITAHADAISSARWVGAMHASSRSRSSPPTRGSPC
jgi:TetR/AcrR family transcriptional repressor of nem operon